MIIKIIDDNNYLVNIIDDSLLIKDIYNRDEIKELIKKTLEKLLNLKTINGTLIFNIYIDSNNNIIIKIYKINNKGDNCLNIKINFHLDNTFLYKIEYFDINKLNISNYNLYYYKDNFYLKLNKKLENYQLIELSELIYDNKCRDIINKGILIT